jgi:hypothetical protein
MYASMTRVTFPNGRRDEVLKNLREAGTVHQRLLQQGLVSAYFFLDEERNEAVGVAFYDDTEGEGEGGGGGGGAKGRQRREASGLQEIQRIEGASTQREAARQARESNPQAREQMTEYSRRRAQWTDEVEAEEVEILWAPVISGAGPGTERLSGERSR